MKYTCYQSHAAAVNTTGLHADETIGAEAAKSHTLTQNKAQSFLHVNGQNLSRTVNSFYNSYNLHNTENTPRSSLV